MMRLCWILGSVALVTTVAGCGGTPAAPSRSQLSSATASIPNQWQISGTVTEPTSGRPISNVFVVATGCGVTRSADTDSLGQYTINLPVSPTACSEPGTIKLTSIGFETQTGRIQNSTPAVASFVLAPIAGPTTDLSGLWTLTITATPSCGSTLAAVARERRYSATMSQVGVRVIMTLASPTLAVLSLPVGGTGTIIDGRLSLVIVGDTGPIIDGDIVWDYPDFVEWVAPTDAVAVMGELRGSVVGADVQGTMKGEFEYWSGLNNHQIQGPPTAICRADDHRIVLRRQS